MDDVTLAMLGDKEAAERLTEAGVLLPCCGNTPKLHFFDGLNSWAVECAVHGNIHNTGFCGTKEEAIRVWNTCAAVLTPEQLEKLK